MAAAAGAAAWYAAPWVWAAGSAVLSGIGGALDFRGGKKGQDAAWDQASLTYDTRMEEIRRRESQQEKTMARGKGVAHSSGIKVEGSSTEQYLDTMQTEFAKELDWMRHAAQKEKKAIRKGAPGRGANLASSLGGVAQGLGRSFQLWQG